MKYKQNWAEAKERLTSWWAGEQTDRVVTLLHAPRDGVERRPATGDVPQKYTDADSVFHNLDAGMEATFYGGEAFPCHWVYLGPTPLSGCMGCEKEFQPDTVWHHKRFDSWSAVDALEFDPSNQWYRLLRELTKASLERAQGNYLVTGQGFGCVSDVIADLWGSEETLMAMLEEPRALATAVQKLTDISRNLYDEMDALCTPHQDGTIDWLRLWAPGRIWTMQSDICCMISPQAFGDFVQEELRQEAEHVDYSFYHLDGPGAIKHLDALLEIQALDGIQWVPGAGERNDPLDWIDLFRRVQDVGKKLLIYCSPDKIKPLLSRISKHGVCLGTDCRTQTEAEELLLELDRMGG